MSQSKEYVEVRTDILFHIIILCSIVYAEMIHNEGFKRSKLVYNNIPFFRKRQIRSGLIAFFDTIK